MFVHVSAIEGTGYKSLKEGQRVEFDVGPARKGDEARTVRPVEAVGWATEVVEMTLPLPLTRLLNGGGSPTKPPRPRR